MKRYILVGALLTAFVSAPAFCQELDEERGLPEEELDRQIHMRNMQLEFQEHEADVDFRHQMRQLELQQRRRGLEREAAEHKHPPGFKKHKEGNMLPLLLICFVVHILLAVWVYKDIRQRNAGSGIWIVIVLLTGLLGVVPYAIVRLGDIREAKS